MKGLNVKKIAALAAGALFIGSAAVAAGVIFEDTQLVSDQGVPQATVIVGSNAMVSDGIAAGRIAAKLASESYKEMTYTATTAGAGTCTPVTTGTETETAGTCPITDESVTLKITSPGISGVYSFNPNIYDVLDRDLTDREDTNDLWDGADDDDDTGPFFENSGTGDDLLAVRVDSDFSPFADYSFSAAGMDFTEKQFVYVEGTTDIQSDDEPYGDIDQVIYSAKFYWDKDNGIPVCTNEEANNWAYCLGANYGSNRTTDSTKEITRKRPSIKLFNDNWYLIDMHPPDDATNLTNEDDRVTGGDVTLAKESAYGILDIGDSLTSGNYKITLDDISTATGGENEHPAIISVYDTTTGEKLAQQQIDPGTDEDVDVGGGDTITVHVYETAPGYTLTSKWAEMAVFGQKWKLNNGDEITDNDHWYINLFWKNEDGGDTDDDDNQPDNLREIVFYNDDGWTLNEGDPIGIMDNPEAFELTYSGLETKEMTSLTFEFSKDKINECGCTGDCKINDDGDKLWLEVTTRDGKFKGTTNDGIKVYVALDDGNVGANVTKTLNYGDVWVYDDNDNCIREETNSTSYTTFDYHPAGSTDGQVSFNTTNMDGTGHDWVDITLTQEVGKVNSADDTSDTVFCADYDTTSGDVSMQHTCDGGTRDDDPQADYTVAGGAGFASVSSLSDINETVVDDEFIDLRGTVYDMSNTKYVFDIPSSPRKMQFIFKSAGTEAEPNTKELVMHEGDTETIGDTTIEVESIDEEVGACTTTGTGAASCMYEEGSVTGAIQAPDGTTVSSLTAMTPGSVNPSTLIKLDKDAMNDAVFISVGGPAVNEVTARELTGANAIDFNTENVVTKQISQGKIIVAGLTAQDTLTAADQFIAQLQRTE